MTSAQAGFSLCTLAIGDFQPHRAIAEFGPYPTGQIRVIVEMGVSQDTHTSKQCSGNGTDADPTNNDTSTYRRQACRKSSSPSLRSQLPHRLQAARRKPQKKNSWSFSPNPFRWNPLTPASTSNRTLTIPGRAVGPAHVGHVVHRPNNPWGLVC